MTKKRQVILACSGKSSKIPPLFYYGILEEHLFKFILVMVALQRSLLENVRVQYFYHAVNQNIIFRLTTLPTGRDGDTLAFKQPLQMLSF